MDACPWCSSTDLEEYGRSSAFDGRRSVQCKKCGRKMWPRRPRYLTWGAFALGLVVAVVSGVFLAVMVAAPAETPRTPEEFGGRFKSIAAVAALGTACAVWGLVVALKPMPAEVKDEDGGDGGP